MTRAKVIEWRPDDDYHKCETEEGDTVRIDLMVDGTGSGKRLIDPRESHYITALVELRRQMAEMQATVTRMVEGK